MRQSVKLGNADDEEQDDNGIPPSDKSAKFSHRQITTTVGTNFLAPKMPNYACETQQTTQTH